MVAAYIRPPLAIVKTTMPLWRDALAVRFSAVFVALAPVPGTLWQPHRQRKGRPKPPLHEFRRRSIERGGFRD